MLPIVMALVKKVARYDKIFSEGQQVPQVAVIYKGNQVGGKREKKTHHTRILILEYVLK
jgi:hypothetical protein